MKNIKILELIDIANEEQERIGKVFQSYESPILDSLYETFNKEMGLDTIEKELDGMVIYDLLKTNNDGYSISRFKEYDNIFDIISDEEIDNEQKIIDLDRIKKAYYVHKLRSI